MTLLHKNFQKKRRRQRLMVQKNGMRKEVRRVGGAIECHGRLYSTACFLKHFPNYCEYDRWFKAQLEETKRF